MKPPPATHVGEVIRRWRVAAGIRQAELARRINYAPAHVCQIENGSSGLRLKLAAVLCRELGRSMDDLVREAGL